KHIFTKSLKDAAAVDALTAEVARVTAFYNAWMAHEVGSHTADVLTIAEALLGLYTDLKNAHAQMDYDDLILGAVHLLAEKNVAPWVLFKLDGGIDHILVDEAQDTSAEQWRIIDALTQEFFAGQTRSDAERSLFVVGDEKQSIFSFQGADPAALGTMQSYFKARINDAAKPVHALELTKSYRSTTEVLTAVDAVFALPRAKKGVMFLEAPLAHVAHREGNGIVELWPLTKADGEGEFATSARTCLARQIADTIAGWLENGETISSRGRRITPGDIMILVQTRTVIVDRLTRALKKRGIPVAGQDRMELNDNLAVQDLLALGQVLLLPEDDLSLACVLKSPIFNFSEEDLFELAYGRGKQSLWERLHNTPKFVDALELLQDLRARADFIPPYELYAYLLDTLGARAKILGRMGVEYGDPIDEFLNQTLLYERAHAPSLQGFIHWLTHSQSQIKRDMEQANNAVRIMTVHGSKGLQAPIVFLPDTTKTPTVKESVFWLQREGKDALPLRATASENMDEVTRGVRDARKEMELAEYRRLLYVALTRAEDRVYVCGALSRGDSPNDESWYALAREGLATVAQDMGEGGLRLGVHPLSSSPP
ncbi:MAG: double-strand break repair helicase AddA, partial [Alphaproteobacteria bacterium]|nr:double-strand break repair helicase AddA [Alphaproteobacteria bacterium]